MDPLSRLCSCRHRHWQTVPAMTKFQWSSCTAPGAATVRLVTPPLSARATSLVNRDRPIVLESVPQARLEGLSTYRGTRGPQETRLALPSFSSLAGRAKTTRSRRRLGGGFNPLLPLG